MSWAYFPAATVLSETPDSTVLHAPSVGYRAYNSIEAALLSLSSAAGKSQVAACYLQCMTSPTILIWSTKTIFLFNSFPLARLIPAILYVRLLHTRALRHPRRAAAGNLWAPPPTFGDRRAAAADILSTGAADAILVAFQKGHQKISLDRKKFSLDSFKKIWGRPRRSSAAADLFGPADQN